MPAATSGKSQRAAAGLGLRFACSAAMRHTAGRALPTSGASWAKSFAGTNSASSGAASSGSARNLALQLWQRSALLALIASQALQSFRLSDDEHDEQDSSPTLLSCPQARHLRVAMVGRGPKKASP